MSSLTPDEQDMVRLVADFVDERVRPRVREFEADDIYPEELIEEMKKLGFFGLLVPAEHGGVDVSTACFARVTEELARGWMSLAGAIGGHSVIASYCSPLRDRGAAGVLPAPDGRRQPARHDGADRAVRRQRPAGHAYVRRPRRRRASHHRLEDLDLQRPPPA